MLVALYGVSALRTHDALAAIAAAGLTLLQAEVLPSWLRFGTSLLKGTCGWRICPTRTSSSSFPSTCGSDRRANTSHSTRTSPNASRFGGAWPPGGGPRGTGCPGHPLVFVYAKYLRNIFAPKIPETPALSSAI